MAQAASAHRPPRRPDGWAIGALAVAAIVLAPIVAVAVLALGGGTDWPHLWSTTLPRYLGNSLLLMIGVGALAGVLGAGTAWLVVNRDFPGRPVLQYALLMPLAIPAYVAAYALVDFLEYAGPVQTALRQAFGWATARDYWFPEVRSRWVAILVMGLALYPYVYLMARVAFEAQGAAAADVARALGCGPWRMVWRVSLPMARPAIAAGVAVVMMEVLNDFGTVEYFAVQTLTTGVFSLWLEASDRAGAAQVAVMMLLIVLGLVLAERLSRRHQRFHGLSRAHRPVRRLRLRGGWSWAATGACAAPVGLGFVLPLAVIATVARTDDWLAPGLWTAALHTLSLGAAAAAVALAAAVFLSQAVRYARSAHVSRIVPVTTIGYAAPGAVLAVGLLIPLAALDHAVADGVEALFGVDPGLLMTGSAAALVLAYVVRFFAIAQGSVDSAMGRVTPAMDAAARSLGQGRAAILRRVHLPLIRGAMGTAAVLIFVDTVKELPATLMLRPFNFDTLATRVYNHASLEDLERAAPAALLVMAAGLLPVLIMALRHRDGSSRDQ